MMTDLLIPNAHYDQQWSGAVAIFSAGHTPTVDFYLTSRLRHDSQVFQFTSLHVEPSAYTLPAGTFVVVVRHTSNAWLNFIASHQHLWSGVAYLMDDDIPRAVFCQDIPFDYALWTNGRYLKIKKKLARVCDRIWLSTKALQSRYRHIDTQLIAPQYFGKARAASAVGVRRWGYHGTRIHKREMKWLQPIVSAVQQAVPEAEFEVFGDNTVNRLFQNIPRVKVMPSLSWTDYLAHCEASELAVCVAPMLPGRFNTVRSYSKVFDIVRCGAIGVFSDSEPYAALKGCKGAELLKNNQATWADAIINLLQDDTLRLNKFEQLLNWVNMHSQSQSMAALISQNVGQK